ncbi:metalloreductase STEAP4-like [Engraulis encrasicolus]|uniref:metalloreductase STEAP4-like n=1 Tax=Engraulis encrasicolus TaxID=184585 RepID=UPI002FCF7B71
MTGNPKHGTVCIFGTGDFGRSLGLRLLQAGYEVVFGSRDPKNNSLVPKGSKVMTHAEAAQMARVIFIAVQRDHYQFLTSLTSALEGKVLVDISNNLKMGQYPQSNAEYLNSLVPGASVVKGFNTVSAWALQSGALDASRQVLLCGDDPGAKQAVVDIAHSLGLSAQDRGSLRAAGEIEDIPLQLFPMWRLPLWITAVLCLILIPYLIVYYIVYSYVEQGQDNIYRIMLSLPNKLSAILSLTLMALCYLPSSLAAILQLHNGTKYKRFPDWLDRWMLCRKQLGLIGLLFAVLHAVLVFVVPLSYSYEHGTASDIVDQIRENVTEPFENLWAWRSESYKSLGVLGFVLFLLLGITSLPSVSNTLNWREFRFVQSKLGHLALLLCTVHCFLYGWNKFLLPSRYRWYLPPPYMAGLVVPCVVLVFKLLVLTPCVHYRVSRIRQGWEKPRRRSTANATAANATVPTDKATSL